MCGSFNDASSRASRSNRATRSVSFANISGRIFTATLRPSFVSVAWYTSPIPPAPRSLTISYVPNLVPAINAIENLRDYTQTNLGTQNIASVCRGARVQKIGNDWSNRERPFRLRRWGQAEWARWGARA